MWYVPDQPFQILRVERVNIVFMNYNNVVVSFILHVPHINIVL